MIETTNGKFCDFGQRSDFQLRAGSLCSSCSVTSWWTPMNLLRPRPFPPVRKIRSFTPSPHSLFKLCKSVFKEISREKFIQEFCDFRVKKNWGLYHFGTRTIGIPDVKISKKGVSTLIYWKEMFADNASGKHKPLQNIYMSAKRLHFIHRIFGVPLLFDLKFYIGAPLRITSAAKCIMLVLRSTWISSDRSIFSTFRERSGKWISDSIKVTEWMGNCSNLYFSFHIYFSQSVLYFTTWIRGMLAPILFSRCVFFYQMRNAHCIVFTNVWTSVLMCSIRERAILDCLMKQGLLKILQVPIVEKKENRSKLQKFPSQNARSYTREIGTIVPELT